MISLILQFNRLETVKNVRTYNLLDPTECLELHLKKVVVDDYGGMGPDVDFIKFFVLNAKVLKEMYLGVVPSCNNKWMANQRRLLQLDNKASPGARFAFDNRAAGDSHPKIWNDDPFEWFDQRYFLRLARILD